MPLSTREPQQVNALGFRARSCHGAVLSVLKARRTSPKKTSPARSSISCSSPLPRPTQLLYIWCDDPSKPARAQQLPHQKAHSPSWPSQSVAVWVVELSRRSLQLIRDRHDSSDRVTSTSNLHADGNEVCDEWRLVRGGVSSCRKRGTPRCVTR